MDGPLLAPRAVWRRLLSVDKCPSLMTYAAVPQMHRTRRQVRRWSVSHGAPCGRRQGQVLTRRERAAAGRGVLP
jgi:hypothetical protein